ncbi:MAG TPA: TRL domain-containing protein [Planctomycetota bacterium]|nr:TRL domain-containing protein [Planctomycetota bacterium]
MSTRPAVSALLIALVVLALGGCAVHRPPVGGLLYSDCTMPAVWTAATPHATSDYTNGPAYEKVGRTRGEASSTSILGLVWVGDSGGGTAYERALQKVGADALLSPRLDYHGYGVLGLFAEITVTVEGEGIRFQKPDAQR